MKILKKTHKNIIADCPGPPPEVGGIIGGGEGVVSEYVLDLNVSGAYDGYRPDVTKLNGIIKDWANREIEFYGIFHSHFPGGVELSKSDKSYIELIMKTMPPEVSCLYFPLIITGETMVAYKAEKRSGKLYIIKDSIITI